MKISANKNIEFHTKVENVSEDLFARSWMMRIRRLLLPMDKQAN